MAVCDHKYTHTTVRIAVRDDGDGPRQVLDIVFYCLVCAQTSGTNMASRSTDWHTALRLALPEVNRIMSDFGIPLDVSKLDA